MRFPNCESEMESGYVNAAVLGIGWYTNPRQLWLLAKGVELLQSDWLGLWPFRPVKAPLPAVRCRKCHIVTFRYSNVALDTCDASPQPGSN
jgi:hypothetical protein